jgi:cytochrome c biogenesis factor
MSKGNPKKMSGPEHETRKNLALIIALVAGSLLLWLIALALISLLVAYFNLRWPRAVVLVFVTFGILVLVLPTLIETVHSRWPPLP